MNAPTTQREADEPCKRCNGEGCLHTGIDEAPTTLCERCDGSGIEAPAATDQPSAGQVDEQAAFEAWAELQPSISLLRETIAGMGDYADPYAQWLYDGWLARASLTPTAPYCTEPNRKACPRLCADFCNAAEQARMKCDDCDGRGHDGDFQWQGHFQPPEPGVCNSCGGTGWAEPATPTAPAAPTGYKLVPLKCTPEMRAAWDRAPQHEDGDVEFFNAYRAMIDTTPTAPQAASQQADCKNCDGNGQWLSGENCMVCSGTGTAPQAATTASALIETAKIDEKTPETRMDTGFAAADRVSAAATTASDSGAAPTTDAREGGAK